MLRCAYVPSFSSSFVTQFSNYQSIRWKRSKKPFWLGLAKSKMFVLPKPKPISEDEKKEKLRLERLYNCSQFMKVENPLRQKDSSAEAEKLIAQENFKKEIEESFLRNDQWNATSAGLRELRLKETWGEFSNFALAKIQRVENSIKENQKRVEKVIELEKIKSKSFITPENLDEAVESCLNTVIDYNFAIDLAGNKYKDLDDEK